MPLTEPEKKNILVGAAALYVGTTTAVAPVLTANNPAGPVVAAATGWSQVGYTDGGVEVSYEPAYTDITVDQLLDSAIIFKSGMKVMVNTTLSEATLENLLIVWGAQTGDLTTSGSDRTLQISAGNLGDFPVERQLIFVGPGPRVDISGNTAHKERVYSINRAIQTNTTAHSLKRDAATTLPVSFRCLPGSNLAGNTTTAYGTVVDRTIA
jgi:hypothetical protein